MTSKTKKVNVAYFLQTEGDYTKAVIFSVSGSLISVKFAAMMLHPTSSHFLEITNFPVGGQMSAVVAHLHGYLGLPVTLAEGITLYEDV